MVMPHEDRVEIRRGAEINLHPLLARPEFNPRTFLAPFVAVREQVERADDWFLVAGCYFLAGSDIVRADGHHTIRALALARRFEIRDLGGNRRADEHRLG